MARKTLLTESELRNFMKLANLQPLGAGKLEEMGYGDKPAGRDDDDEEDKMEEELALDTIDEEEMEMDMEMGAEEPAMDDAPPMDDEPAMDMER